MSDAIVQPNNTVYINNLNEKISVEELKKSIFHVCGQFGTVLDVNAKKTMAAKGQAFVIFDDVASATRAVRDLSGFNFYGKPMRITYAKSKSDVISQRDGSFVARPKRKADQSDNKPAAKQQKSDKASVSSAFQSTTQTIVDDEVPPHSVLFVQQLPVEASQQMVAALFSPYDGFKEARVMEGKPGLAFVEFHNEFQATRAMESLQGFKVTPAHAMQISYAKK